jgi:hypothetical protein
MIHLLATLFIFFQSHNKLNNYQEREVSFEEITLGCRDVIESNHVVKNNDQYQNLRSKYNNSDFCKKFKLPHVNFERFVVLGFEIYVQACEEPIYEKRIYNRNDTTYVNLSVISKGQCLTAYPIEFWSKVLKDDIHKHVVFNKNVNNDN